MDKENKRILDKENNKRILDKKIREYQMKTWEYWIWVKIIRDTENIKIMTIGELDRK